MTERRIRLAPEVYLGALEYGDRCTATTTILAVHGWMDNAASFALVAPALQALGYHVLCLDLPGHGKSDHLPPSSYYLGMQYAAHILEVADELKLQRFILLGHSLGGGLAAMLTGAYPSRVVGAILIENLGPSARAASDAVALFAKAVEGKRGATRHSEGSVYSSIDAAVSQRISTVARYEGHQTLSREAASALVQRALEPVSSAGGGWRFIHDRRIAAPSLLHPTEEQICSFLSAIRAPVLLVRGATGWPVNADVLAHRKSLLGDLLTFVELPGSHHLHLDEDTAPPVIAAMSKWLVQLAPVTENSL